ncbi:hypothetical protein Syun_024201 [Stephania yunnanensis]|uniref:Uncharacterized protein n=1 Tax=Stephania yunnanensis TaxID=152371 RepID=A0AAP0FAC9_9MAGN
MYPAFRGVPIPPGVRRHVHIWGDIEDVYEMSCVALIYIYLGDKVMVKTPLGMQVYNLLNQL